MRQRPGRPLHAVGARREGELDQVFELASGWLQVLHADCEGNGGSIKTDWRRQSDG
jgi:hypothetical protein